MFTQVNFTAFCDKFASMDRKDNFTYEGKQALFDYLEGYEDSTGEKIELDVIALYCEYTEYDSAWDAMEYYQPEDMPLMGEDGDDLLEIQEKNEAEALRWLQDHTTVIDVEGGGVIIQDF